MPFTWVTVRPGRSTPADLVNWRLLQTGRRSDPELESVLTLLPSYTDGHWHRSIRAEHRAWLILMLQASHSMATLLSGCRHPTNHSPLDKSRGPAHSLSHTQWPPEPDICLWHMELGISSCPCLSCIRSWHQRFRPLDQYSTIVRFFARS